MKFALNPNSKSPLYAQLEDQILCAISLGELRPGDTLPSIRELENEIGINRNTARTAYLNLEAKGILYLRQGQLARVADEPPILQKEREGLAEIAEDLSAELIRKIEASGVDGLTFLEYHKSRVVEHDQHYPRCAFVECNELMADSIARSISEQLGRCVVPHVLGVDDDASLPSSIRVVFTSHWHLAETREAFAGRQLRVQQLELRITPSCISQLNALEKTKVTVVVRDAESAPGYLELTRKYAKPESIDVVIAEDVRDSRAAFGDVDSVVCTAPCKKIVSNLFPASQILELVFEPSPEALIATCRRLFPPLEKPVLAQA